MLTRSLKCCLSNTKRLNLKKELSNLKRTPGFTKHFVSEIFLYAEKIQNQFKIQNGNFSFAIIFMYFDVFINLKTSLVIITRFQIYCIGIIMFHIVFVTYKILQNSDFFKIKYIAKQARVA